MQLSSVMQPTDLNTWYYLQDHMRRAGDVCFAQVFRDGSGKSFLISCFCSCSLLVVSGIAFEGKVIRFELKLVSTINMNFCIALLQLEPWALWTSPITMT